MEKKTLESLVPPLDLCKQIPQGAFENSVLVWFGHRHTDKTMKVVPRNELGVACQFFLQKGVRVAYPAPTLQEILAVLPCDMLADFYLSPTDRGTYRIDMVTNDTASEIANADNPATAALRLWFDVKGRG